MNGHRILQFLIPDSESSLMSAGRGGGIGSGLLLFAGLVI